MKFNCEKCGDVDHIRVDGYSFGDRLLEGVIFLVSYKNGKLVAETRDEDKGYMRDLNEKKWLKVCIEHVEGMEDDCEGQCPHCGLDIFLRTDDVTREEAQAQIEEGQGIDLPLGKITDLKDL